MEIEAAARVEINVIVRPAIYEEKEEGLQSLFLTIKSDKNEIELHSRNGLNKFQFDRIFDCRNQQMAIELSAEIVQDTWEGKNTSTIAYGPVTWGVLYNLYLT